jgi:hypothetical protein
MTTRSRDAALIECRGNARGLVTPAARSSATMGARSAARASARVVPTWRAVGLLLVMSAPSLGNRANTRATCTACHAPRPDVVGMPRRFNSVATPCNVDMPLARMILMMGASPAARASVRSVRILRARGSGIARSRGAETPSQLIALADEPATIAHGHPFSHDTVCGVPLGSPL